MFEKGQKKAPGSGRRKPNHGGSRPGAGGPRGPQGPRKHTLMTVDRYVRMGYAKLPDEETTPLKVMLENMDFYHRKAADLGFDLLAALKDRGATPDQLLKFYAQFSKMRDKAQGAATDAAPYCHPKLNVLGVKSLSPAHLSDEDLIAAIEAAMPGLDIDELAKEIDGEFAEAAE